MNAIAKQRPWCAQRMTSHYKSLTTSRDIEPSKDFQVYRMIGLYVHTQGRCYKKIANIALQLLAEMEGTSRSGLSQKMPTRVTGKVYKTIISLVLIYGAEAWSL